MSFIAFATLAAAYLTVRPFVKVRILKTAVEDDLGDYYRSVCNFQLPLTDIMLVLQENGLLDEDRRERLAAAHVSLKSIVTWDDVARSDRLVVEAIDDALRVLDASDVKFSARCYENAKVRFNTIDEKLIEVRRLLDRDIPVLNQSFVHKFRLLSRLMKIPTYPMAEPVKWYTHREPTNPREIYIY